MRRVIPLESIYYINKLAEIKSRITTFSGQYNINLKKLSGNQQHFVDVRLFAKFNSKDLNGFQILAGVEVNGYPLLSIPESLNVYRVSDDSWSKTLIGSLTMTEHEPSVFSAFASNAFLGMNELSGAETYLLEVKLKRFNIVYTKKQYFNHLGCFDNILQLRQQTELLSITKLDI
jgi:hypothetical protein